MKIVIVLCFLATFAIAVPVYQENVFESSLSDQPLSTKREKKSALPDITPGLSPEYGIEKIQSHSSKKSVQGTSVEAKSLRRPIIIKRKLGYHVYRDSDEEMAYAEPGEKCREQVKFKLCDHEPVSSSKNRIKSPTFKCMESYKTDNVMENSIKMAKQAVEYVQKDLKRMENFSPKLANPHIEDIESNSGLHHDIEIAREALENIEQNFESVNLEVNKVNELQIPKSQDVKRLTRWREAIENIHKNFEIVKNIEEAFQTDNHFSLFRSNNKKADESEEPTNIQSHFNVQNKLTNDNLEINGRAYNEDKIFKSASNDDGIAQITSKTENIDNIGKDEDYDMFISPTENRERNVQLHSDNLKSEINYKDASLKSDASEIEFTKQDTNLPKESIEYSPKNSNYLSEVPTNKEHEKIENDNINNDYKLDIEHHPEQRTLQYSKSVPELPNDPMLLITTKEKVDITDQHAHKEVTGMRSSKSQNEKLQINEYREEPMHASTRLDIENNSDDTIALNFKSVPELQPYPVESLPLDKQEIANDQQSHREEASMRSSVSQNEKIQSSENQEEHENLPKGLGIERLSEERIWQDAKSVPELPYDPMLSVITSEKGDNIDDPQAHNQEAGMKSSESQNEKLILNEYQEESKLPFTRLDIENNSDDITGQYFKSVPELRPYAVESLPLDKGEITNDQQAHREEASMTSTARQNEKMQSSENQEEHELLPMGLIIERLPEEGIWQDAKSVPQLPYDPMLSLTTSEKVDNTDDQHAHKEEASMRSSESQNEMLQLNEYREEPKQVSMGFDIENSPDDTRAQYFKSVPELQRYPLESLPLDKGDITNGQQSYREEASMRSTESQNEKMQSIENKEEHELLSMGLGIERLPEERIWQDAKSVLEPSYDPMLSTTKEKVDNTDDQHGHTDEAGMRSSDGQNEKLQSNEYREEPKQASTGLDVENNSDDTTAQYFKSVPELQPYPVESLPLDMEDVTNDQQSPKEEASMRSSESQNEKTQTSENQEEHELLPMGLDIERLPEERIWQDAKSVPELSYDSMLPTIKEKVDNTDDQHDHREEAAMRSSDSQNEKLQSNEYREEPKQASTGLDVENNSDDTTAQYFKSVPELQPYPVESFPLDMEEVTNDQQFPKAEASMRSSESQNEKTQTSDNQEEHELLPMGLGIERLPEERIWQDAKSVPELSYDSMLSTTKEKVDNTDDQHGHTDEAGMRSSESQNEKLQSNEYREEPKQASTGLDVENNSDDTTAQYFKSVPELQPYPVESLPLDMEDVTNDQQSPQEEASMRSSESQNEKTQSIENQEEHELLPMGLDIERLPEERIWQDAKSVPELSYDSMLPTIKEKVDNTDDQHDHREEAAMRSSDSQNEKLQSNEYREEPKQASTGLDVENNSDDTTAQYFKSVPELQPYPVESFPLDMEEVTNDQQFPKAEASMRSSESQNEKTQTSDNQEEHELLPMGLGIERLPEERIWQDAKSVPELSYDSMLSTTKEKVDNTDDQHGHTDEAGMRSSESQNEKLQSNEYREEPKQASTGLDVENNSDDTTAQYFKSVPELQPYPVESLPLDMEDVTNDQQSPQEEASMRSSESQNEKTQSIENQEEHELLPMGLDIERLPEERIWQDAKSVPELSYDPMLSTTKEKVDNIDDQHDHREEAAMRLSDSQNKKLHLNDYREDSKQASKGLDVENNSDDITAQYFKSVSELQRYPLESLLLNMKEVTNDQQFPKAEASMRSSESQNEKTQTSDNQEEHELLPMGLGIERLPEERIWQDAKSVPELSYDSMLPTTKEKVDNTDDQHGHTDEAGMRSSESQNEKLQSNEYREEPKQASTGLDVENNSDDTTAQYFKSVPELQPYPVESLPLDKEGITNDQQSHKEEASMRSSESQNEKSQTSENQEEHELLPMGLDIERLREERIWQDAKSVPELSYDPMLSTTREKVDYTDDQHDHTDEASMRSSESQNEKLQLNEYREEPKQASTGLDVENNSDDTTAQYFKSVPELQRYPLESLTLDKEEITNDQQSHKEEASMRSSESQNEKTQTSENQEELLRMGLGIERLPEERIWQDAKSVPELSYDPLLSVTLAEKVYNTDDQQAYKEETGMRSSESQNEKLQLNEYREEPKQASTRLDIENSSTAQYFKSVPELQPYPVESLPLENRGTTNDQQSYREEASMRSSDSQNEKMQSSENQEVHKFLPMRSEFESHPEDRIWQYSKSVPELPYDPMLSMPTEKVVNTIHQHAYKEEAYMKSSDSLNDKLQLNENQETHEPLMIHLDMTNHPEDRKWLFSKSVPEFSYDPMVSMPSDKIEITNRQPFRKEGNMRLPQNQHERTPFDEHHGMDEFLPTKLDDARLSQTQRERQQIYFNHHLYEPHSSRFDIKSKLEHDSPANKLRFNYIQNPTKEQTVMRLSQNQNENKEIQYPSTSLGLSNDMSGVDNAAHIMNDFMHLSEAQPEQLHENRDPMLRSSNERHHLSHNFNSLPGYKMLPQTSQFEFSNGQHAHNEHINMRINQEQSRDPEPMENQYKHNSLPMRWNIQNQQDPSSKAFKSNLDFDHTPYKGNEFGNEQFTPASKTVDTLEYRSRPQLYGEHILDDTPSRRFYQTVQHNDRFANYYKTLPEVQEENTNPHLHNHLHRIALNHRLNDADTFASHDFPSSRARLYDHMQKYHQEKPSNIDDSMEPSMHMSMRDPFAKSGSEFNNMYFNHPHGTARFVKGLPIAGVSPGAMRVFPTGSAGGCGIPLLLSCSPSIVSGSLARPNIAGPLLKSVDDNFKYYIKRDAKIIGDEQDIKIQKLSLPHSHGAEAASEI